MAAFVAARIAQHVTEIIPVKKIVCLSDSQIVLHWLKTAKPLNSETLIANRVTEIKKLTSDCEWRYCPTDENPADLQTQGISAVQFESSSLWVHGPRWLCNISDWPRWEQNITSAFATVVDREAENSSPTTHEETTGLHKLIDVQSYSSYQKMVRVTSYMLRFINNSRPSSRDARTCGPLTTEERRIAEKKLIRDQQQQSCRDVICELHVRKHKLSIIRQLRLYLDEGDCIRIAGRIHNAHLPKATKFPLLLPPKKHLTKLIIQDAHSRQLHAGVSQTVTLLRQKF